MPRARTSRKAEPQANGAEDRPTSRLMRVPTETYEIIQRYAQEHRRHMNQELAVIVEEWDRMQRGRGRKAG